MRRVRRWRQLQFDARCRCYVAGRGEQQQASQTKPRETHNVCVRPSNAPCFPPCSFEPLQTFYSIRSWYHRPPRVRRKSNSGTRNWIRQEFHTFPWEKGKKGLSSRPRSRTGSTDLLVADDAPAIRINFRAAATFASLKSSRQELDRSGRPTSRALSARLTTGGPPKPLSTPP